MTTNPLDAIQARADTATEGPWVVPPYASPLRDEVTAPNSPGLTVPVCEVRSPSPNAVFIAHAREDVPKLVAALRAVEAVHVPQTYEYPEEFPECAGCRAECMYCEGDHLWPCSTIAAIREALDG